MIGDSHGSPSIRALFFLAVAVLATACADRAAEEQPPEGSAAEEPALAVQFAPSLDVDLARMTRTPTGLYIEDVQEGSGEEAAPGQTVAVHYTGWLPSGEEFDSSHDRGEPYTVTIGESPVIDGWQEGIPGMRPGGRRKLVIPPDLAYGAEGRPPVIPPNATLVFDVELIEAR